MRKLTVTISDEFYAKLMTFLAPNPEIIVEEKSDDSVPLWQQEMVLERIKNSKPEDYIDAKIAIDSFKKNIRLTNNFK
jgi:hypothetical protein